MGRVVVEVEATTQESGESMSQAPPGFEQQSPIGDAIPVFVAGQGRGVVLLHEGPGLTRECVELGRRLSGEFRVYMPLLFGKPCQPPRLGTLVRACISREINCLACGTSSPIANKLRALCQVAHKECGGPGVGVIGMCLTGGFTLTLMLEPSVIAPVLSQPSLPLPILGRYSPRCLKSSLGTDPDSLVKAAERNIDVLGLRFSEDWRCPPERFDSLGTLFKERFHVHPLASGQGTPFPSSAHSVLTYREHAPLSPAAAERAHLLRHAYDSLTVFLRQRLH